MAKIINDSKPYISIIVPTLNEEKNLPRLLRSFIDLKYPKEKYEVLIIDGGSSDQTGEIARKFGAKVFNNPFRLRGAGCQIGVEKARGEYIAFTDADCRVPEDWLLRLIKGIRGDKEMKIWRERGKEKKRQKIGAAGGPNRTPTDDADFAKAAGEVLELLSKPGSRYGYQGDKVTEIYHNSGCNVLYRKEAIIKAGGYDPDLITCEDEELDFRIRKAGYKLLYSPLVSVDHYRRASYFSFFKQAYRYGAGRMQAGRKHPEMIKWFHYGPSIFLAITLGEIIEAIIWGKAGILGITWLTGLAGLISGGGYLTLRYRHGNIFVYTGLLAAWIGGWGGGFLRGFWEFSRRVDRSETVKNNWKAYWKNYKGVTAIGAWSQKKSLEEAFYLIGKERIKRKAAVIDVGCGEGRTLLTFREKGFINSIGLDFAEESLMICRGKGLRLGKDIFKREAAKTGFREKEFSLVFSEGLLEHFKKPEEIIWEMARISNRYILIIQPNHYSLYGLAIAVLGNLLRNNMREYSFPKKYFIREFEKTGFILKRQRYTPLREFFILLFERKDN